jgi:putative nucleotidyltransferase with HDIG domain
MSDAAAVKLSAAMERIVLGRIMVDKLVLPAMPATAMKCLAILKDSVFHQKKLMTQIESDPLLAALIVRAGNTASYGGSQGSLDQCVSRLGVQRLKGLVVEYASREIFTSRDRKIAETMKKIWDHSVAVAKLSRDIAALVGHEEPDACYQAGLLHDVGKPILAAFLLEAEKQSPTGKLVDHETWSQVIETSHRAVGVALAVEWKLPDGVTAGIRDCSDYDGANRACVSNVVRFANALAKREGFATGPIDAADVDALIMVGRSMVGANEEIIDRLVKSLHAAPPGS